MSRRIVLAGLASVVAGFASWHEGHRSAAAALARKPRVPAHVLVETYSVLTRLPPPSARRRISWRLGRLARGAILPQPTVKALDSNQSRRRKRTVAT